MRGHPLYQLTAVKLRDLLREPEALFWVFAFPVLLSLALGIAFRASGPAPVAVGVQDGPAAEATAAALAGAAFRVERLDAERARSRLRSGGLALVVVPEDPPIYWYDPTRPDSRAARMAVDDALQRAAGRVDPRAVAERRMQEKGSRYIDFLIPGLLGMNLMGTGMWGIGFFIVNARSKLLLKRLAVTPMRRSHFLISQITGRLVFLAAEVGVVLGFGGLAFDVPLRGSLAQVVAVSLVGALAFGGLGLLVASRTRTVEGVSGLINLVMLPMWIGSGTFFSTARFPEALQPALRALPLTAVNDALREVMLDGAGWGSIAGELIVAGAWGAVSFALALRLFRWK
jgi:ABC-type multidrug transport system permease subunit